MNTNHGVLHAGGLLTIQGRNWAGYPVETDQVKTISDAMELALTYGLTHLWIHANTGIADGATFSTHDKEKWDLRITYKGGLAEDNPNRRMSSSYGWRLPKGGQKDITIVFPHNTIWGKGRKGKGGWGTKASPQDLLTTVHYLQGALDLPVGGGASTLGWKHLTKLHPDWTQDYPSVDPGILHFNAQAAQDMRWQRPLTEEELGRLYVHKFDESSAYLDTCYVEYYGVGTPQLLHGEASYMRRVENGKPVGHDRVGVWYCRIVASEVPILSAKTQYPTGTYWLAGPTIRLLRAKGYEVEIVQGYVFPKEHMLLSSWAKNKKGTGLWDIRSAFRENKGGQWRKDLPRQYAEEACKKVAVTTVGLTAYGGFEDEENTDKRRSDIKVQTVAGTYERFYHKLEKCAREDGDWPIMTYFDAAYYMSDNPDGRAVCPHLVHREGQLGGFKYEGRIKVTPDVLACLTKKIPVAKKLEFLNELGWEK